jgi:hypothetical protein
LRRRTKAFVVLARLVRDLERYPIVRLRSPSASPPVGRIGWAEVGGRIVFVDVSPTGLRFVVAVKRGRVVQTNVRRSAAVF